MTPAPPDDSDALDLFERTVLALWAVVLGLLVFFIVAVVLLILLGPDSVTSLQGRLIGGGIALLVSAWSVLSLTGAVAPKESRAGKWARKLIPDGVGEEGLVLGVILYLPAFLLALLLHRLRRRAAASDNRWRGP